MRRRALLLALAGSGATGRSRRSAAGILASTRASTLAPQPVTGYVPRPGTPPAAVTTAGRLDHVADRAGRVLHTRVWYPVGPGPYPVVLFSHGLHSQPGDYTTLLEGWARAGFVVAAPLYPHTSLGSAYFNAYDIANQPADASAVLTAVLALGTGAGPLRGRLDPARLAAAGHSAGGITTAGLFSAHRDPRLTAGILIAGTDFLGTPFRGPAAAMLVVQGRRDDTVGYRAARTVFEAVPWSRAMLTLDRGGHQVSAAELPAVLATTVAFLRWSLYGGALPLPALAGVATFDDQLARSADRTASSSERSTGYGV